MNRASTTLIWFSLTIFVSLGLYHTSYCVEELGRQLKSLNKDIETEKLNIHVLKAEWVYLSNPSRIASAAQRNLDLQPTTPQQVTKVDNLASLVPAHAERLAAVRQSHLTAQAKTPHPAANKPQPVAEEAGRLNTRLVIKKTVPVAAVADATPLPLTEGDDYALAVSGTR